MNCPSCNKLLADEALFCSDCGVSVSTVRINSSTSEQLDRSTTPTKVRKDPLLGHVLDSKYKLLERLGEGGMGAVYRALRLHIGDEVAVKVLHRDLVIEEQAIERFRREARSAAMIRHQNVVSIHDFSDATEDGSTAYIVMELVRGDSLRSLIQSEGRMSPERAVALMRDICSGVGVAHRQGVLHRDLKPDNVIVSPPTAEGDRETAKVVDFGLAKLRDVGGAGLTRTGAVMGTLYYMSPEQCSGEELDARSDVYSLGAMLYEMLTGAPPFQANNLAALIAKHLHEPPRPFDPNLQIPAPLAATVFRALAKDRNERPRDASAFSKEIQNAVTAGPGQLSNSTTPTLHAADETVVPLPGKSGGVLKWIVGGAAGLLLVAVVLLGVGVGIKYVAGKILTSSTNQNTNNSNRNGRQGSTDNTNEEASGSPSESTEQGSVFRGKGNDLRGTWTGTYGHFGEPAKLIIKNQKEGTIDGLLEQNTVQVSFNGTFDTTTRKVTMKQTSVLKDPDSTWLLGTDSGNVSSDGKEMSGTGQDKMSSQLGLTYEWSFKRNLKE